MKAARLHAVGESMRIEEVPRPEPGPNDVLVRVRSCGIAPNLANILANWPTWFPERPQPPLPAIFGLDPAGEIVAVGRQVHAWKPGVRVYVARASGFAARRPQGDDVDDAGEHHSRPVTQRTPLAGSAGRKSSRSRLNSPAA